MIRRLLAIIVLLLLPFDTTWGEVSPNASDIQAGAKLRLNSDRLEYGQEEGIYRADGNATLTKQDGMQLRVNSLWFNAKTKQMRGTGDVAFTQDQNTIFASEIEFDLVTGQGILLDGRLFLEEDDYTLTLTGARFIRLPSNRYILQKAAFTACDCPDNPDWQIKADQIHVTLDRYLVAKNVAFYVNEWPVVVLPYLIYPVVTTRQSGLLIPQMGYSRTHGYRYRQDLFLALAQNHDATLSVDWRDKTGSGGGLEYRYALSQQTGGKLSANYFNDLEKGIDRVLFSYQHTQHFSERTRFALNLNSIHPEDSLLTLSDTTAERSLRSLLSTASLTYRGDESFAYLVARSSRDLTQRDNALNRLPEIGWRLIEHPFGPLFLSEEVTYTRFEPGSGPTWERIDLFPKLSIPLRIGSGITLTPWAGLRPTWYSRSTATDQPFSRNTKVQGVHLMMNGQSGETWPIHFPKHLFYERVLTEDRSDIIQADDIDQLHRRESITLALNPQWLNPNGADPLVSLRLTETYHTNVFSPATQEYSNLRGEIAILPAASTSFKIDTFYNWENENLTVLNADFLINVQDQLKVAIGEHYTRGGNPPRKGDAFNPVYLGDIEPAPQSRFILGHLLTKLSSGLHLATQVYYDQDRHVPIEVHYGLLYLKQCWSVTLAYQDLPDRNEFSFAVHLKGLGPILPKRFAYLFDF